MSSNADTPTGSVDTPLFQLWRPCVRIEPEVQLEYRNPVLRRDQYRDCVDAVGPAVGSSVDELCDTALGNHRETTENTEKSQA